jgi:hypothetical protein
MKITRIHLKKTIHNADKKNTSTSEQTDDVFQIYVAGCLHFTHTNTHSVAKLTLVT